MSQPRIRFGPFETDLDTHELWKNGIRVKLRGQPFEILAALLARPGELVSREELRKKIWSDDTFVDFSHGLNAAMNKLREALCDSADKPRYIETLPRRGYRFIGKMEEVEAGRSPERETISQIESSASEWRGPLVEDGWENPVPVKRQTLVQLWTLAALIALGAAVIGIHWSGPGRRQAKAAEDYEADMKLKLAAEHAAVLPP